MKPAGEVVVLKMTRYHLLLHREKNYLGIVPGGRRALSELEKLFLK